MDTTTVEPRGTVRAVEAEVPSNFEFAKAANLSAVAIIGFDALLATGSPVVEKARNTYLERFERFVSPKRALTSTMVALERDRLLTRKIT